MKRNDQVGHVILRCAQNLGVASKILSAAKNDMADQNDIPDFDWEC